MIWPQPVHICSVSSTKSMLIISYFGTTLSCGTSLTTTTKLRPISFFHSSNTSGIFFPSQSPDLAAPSYNISWPGLYLAASVLDWLSAYQWWLRIATNRKSQKRYVIRVQWIGLIDEGAWDQTWWAEFRIWTHGLERQNPLLQVALCHPPMSHDALVSIYAYTHIHR